MDWKKEEEDEGKRDQTYMNSESFLDSLTVYYEDIVGEFAFVILHRSSASEACSDRWISEVDPHLS
jgi:hypothetical protein